MKTKVFLATLLFCLVVTAQKGFCIILAKDYTLVNQTKKAVLVVAGEVSDIQYVQPDNGYIYTDVTIAVSKVLKGKPNIDKDTVQFRIEGGIGISPVTGKMVRSILSDVPTFEIGQELIVFLEKRWWDEWTFYDGLYPSVYPPASVYTMKENENEYRVAEFLLAFFEQKYILRLPLDVASRLIQNAVKAPEAVDLLEKRIREIKDIRKPENQKKQKVESPEFLLMLQSELTQIDAKIKEKEKKIKEKEKKDER